MRRLLTFFLAGFGFLSAQAAESLLFVGPTDAEATAELLRIPDATPTLRSASLEVSYTHGRDFIWTPGTRELRLVKGSPIPFLTPQQLRPAPKSANAYASHRDGKSWMLFGPGHWFHDRQCAADYASSDPWQPPAIQPATDDQLGLLRKRLNQKQPVKVVMLGDSISTGADASAVANVPPFQPGYPDLFVRRLRERSGADVSLVNLSVGGQTAMWGVQQVAAVIAGKPDLLLIAFGMNDASQRRTPEQFAMAIKAIFEPVTRALPRCEVILISCMTANSDWTASSPELYPAYAAALSRLAGPRIAFADLTTRWKAIVERKQTLDLTGNGLNHPNDYGHRLYADVLVETVSLPKSDLNLESPQDHQIVQQGPNGSAEVKISGTAKIGSQLQWRMNGGTWKNDLRSDEKGRFEQRVSLKAGWHSLEIREENGTASQHVARFGIGEVFLIAGQSNSANSGPEKLRVESGHVSTFDGQRWRIAHDPQPGASGAGGSFAPTFGDTLSSRLGGVPVGIVSIGVGSTSVREWLPAGTFIERQPTTGANVKARSDGGFEATGTLFSRLRQRLTALGPHGVRAILWHQGESDAGQAKDGYPADRQISPADYTRYMQQLIHATRGAAGWEVPWFNALATYHSTKTPGDPEFRTAQALLRSSGHTHAGPDTDDMIGDLRAPDGVHFSTKGLHEHGQRWAAAVHPWLTKSAIVTDFTFPWSDKSAPQTHFHAWTANERLHFIFIVEDADIIVADQWSGESTLDGEDRVEFFFAKDPALKDYWCLEIDSKGRVHDYHAQHYRKFDSTWNCPGLVTTATRTASGYEVHASLPLASLSDLLGKPITRGSEVHLGLFRAEFYGNEKATHGESPDNWLSWVRPDVKQPDFHVPGAFRSFTLP